MDFTVGSYTVAMHTAGTNQWPNVIYNDIVVVAANVRIHTPAPYCMTSTDIDQMLADSLADGSIKLSHAHLIVVSDAQRVVPMVTPHPVIRLMSDFHSKTPDAPRVFATLQSSTDRWASLDFTGLEVSLQARSFFLIPAKKPATWSSPMELVLEYEPYFPDNTEPDVSVEVRKSNLQGTSFRPHHYRRASRVFLQLGPFAAYLYWKSVLTPALTKAGPSESSIAASLENLKSEKLGDKLDLNAASSTCNAAPKLVKLLHMLELCGRYGSAFRGVIYGELCLYEACCCTNADISIL